MTISGDIKRDALDVAVRELASNHVAQVERQTTQPVSALPAKCIMCGGKIIGTSGYRTNNEGKIIATKLLCEKGCRPSFASICDRYPEWQIQLLLDLFIKDGDLRPAVAELNRMWPFRSEFRQSANDQITYREARRIVSYSARLLAQFEENYNPAKVICGSRFHIDEEYNYRWESEEAKEARKERNENRRKGRENRPNYWVVNFESDYRYWISTFVILERSSVELDAAISTGLKRCRNAVGKIVECDDLRAYESVILSHRMIPDQKSKKEYFGQNSVVERLNEHTRAGGLKKWKTFRTHSWVFDLVELMRFDYNYFKPHSFLKGKTPAEVSTEVRIHNWPELIRLAEIVTPLPYQIKRKGLISPLDGSLVPIDVTKEMNDAQDRQRAFRDRKYFSP